MQQQRLGHFCLELTIHIGLILLGIAMIVLQAGRSVLSSTSRLVRVRFASTAVGKKEKLVILGSGWGGYNLAWRADQDSYDVTVVSPNSYFSFTPFLASTTVGTLEYRCATEPVRGIKGINFAQAWAEEIDFANKRLTVESAVPAPTGTNVPDRKGGVHVHVDGDKEFYGIEYDKLVIAVGCYSASLGIEGVAKYAHFLKDIRDARAIRSRLLEIFEIASGPGLSEEQRGNILQIRVVGGGPTGVEYAAELHDFVAKDVERMYPKLKGLINITLYDVAPGILMSFDASLREYAENKFKRSGVNVKGNSKILAVGPDWLELEGEGRVPYGLLVWSTGLSPNPFIDKLNGVLKDEKTHSLRVGPQLQVLDVGSKPIDGVFALGDNATPSDGTKLPATAQVASQMATYLSKSFNKTSSSTEIAALPGFKWSNKGSMVFIGDGNAMVDRTKVSRFRAKLSGFVAYMVWKGFYASSTLGWRNKLLVPMYWTLAIIFGRDVTRF